MERKRRQIPATMSPEKVEDDIAPPSLGWNKDLSNLPHFDDIAITDFTQKTGKARKDKSCIRPEQRGYAFYDEGYIHGYSVCDKGQYFFVRAQCYRSQRKTEKPHKLWFCLAGDNRVKKAVCSCKAGKSGYCNHILALMYQTCHFSKLGCKSVPCKGSKTEIPQEWNKPRGRGKVRAETVMKTKARKSGKQASEGRQRGTACSLYEARRPEIVKNNNVIIDEVKRNLAQINPLFGFVNMAQGDNDDSEFVQTTMGTFVPTGSLLSYQLSISEANFNVDSIDTSIFYKHACSNCKIPEAYPVMPLNYHSKNAPDLQMSNPLLKHVIVTHQESISIEKNTIDQAQCELWYSERSKRLTASNFYEIINRKASRHDAFLKRLLGNPRYVADVKLPPSLKHGRDYEDEAAEKYCDYMKNIGRPVQVYLSGFVVNPQLPHIGCSPDRKIVDPNVLPHFGIAEIKCPYSTCELTPVDAAHYSKEKFSSQIVGNKLVLKKDSAHMVQVQAQLGITGAKWCDYIIYTFKGLHVQRIFFDESMWINSILPRVEKFYFEHYANYYLSKRSDEIA